MAMMPAGRMINWSALASNIGVVASSPSGPGHRARTVGGRSVGNGRGRPVGTSGIATFQAAGSVSRAIHGGQTSRGRDLCTPGQEIRTTGSGQPAGLGAV